MAELYNDNGYIRLKRQDVQDPSKKEVPNEPGKEVTPKKEPVFDFYKKDAETSPLKKVWDHKAGRFILIAIGFTAATVVSGYALQLLAWWNDQRWKFKDSGKGPTGSSPKA